MSESNNTSNVILAAERRRRIRILVSEKGYITVPELSEIFNIGANTIRQDLNYLHNEGILIRSHGGAVAKDEPPIKQTNTNSTDRRSHMEEKVSIAEAALRFIPPSGSIFIGSGSTTYQFALKIKQNLPINVITVSPEVAISISSNTTIAVDLLGGRIRPSDFYSTDCSLAEDALNRLHWETAFMGATGIDIEAGITSIDRIAAVYEKKQMERASKTIILCDSSKLGSFSYAEIGPVTMIDVLVTDSSADTKIVNALKAKGIEVILAE